MSALYNENDAFPAGWLENLVGAGLVAPGRVDRRSIVELQPDDVRDATQFHAFAGIGGWSYALRLAGWPDDLPVWSGSAPCQPFSAAGQRKGFEDKRHLWPEWLRLIRECKPPVIFGEQVSSPDGLGWFDVVHADLEGAGYAVGALDLCAASVGAPHRRQRLYFVALADAGERGRAVLRAARLHAQGQPGDDAARRSEARRLGHSGSDRAQQHARDDAEGEGVDEERRAQGDHGPERASTVGCGLGDTAGARLHPRDGSTQQPSALPREHERSGATRGFWSDVAWLQCSDGTARPAQPGLQPLVDGSPNRVGRLRAYGNCIVPQVAATFIRAVIEACDDGA